MNHLNLIRGLLIGIILTSLNSFAQGIAPASFANEFLAMTVTNGSGPFTTSGSYKFFTTALGTNFNVLGNVGVVLNAGTYSYTKTASNSGVLNLVNSTQRGRPGVELELHGHQYRQFRSFLQRGFAGRTFVATNYANLTAPGVFSPGLTNGQFKGYLSGHQVFSIPSNPPPTTRLGRITPTRPSPI